MSLIISWNMRGLTARVKRSSLRKLITSHDPCFAFVQETKMEEINTKTIRTFWKSNDIDWIFSPSRGNSGGILAVWNSNIFNMKSTVVMQSWIAINGVFLNSNFEFSLITVYNPCSVAARAEVWQQIIEFQNSISMPCLLIGDFNEVLKASERSFSHKQELMISIISYRNYIY